MYTLMLRKSKQRKYHFYDHVTVHFLPRIGEHIVVNDERFVVTDIEHKFLSEMVEPKLLKEEQCGSIYAEEVQVRKGLAN